MPSIARNGRVYHKHDCFWEEISASFSEKHRTVLSLVAKIISIFETYGQEKIQFLMTCRLNQDGLENIFSYFLGGYNVHPNAIDIQNRLRWYVLGKHSTALFSVRANTVPDPLDSSLTEAQNFSSKENPLYSALQQNEDELLINIGSLESSKDGEEKEEIIENEMSKMTYVDDSNPMETDDCELLKLLEGFRESIEQDDDFEGLRQNK